MLALWKRIKTELTGDNGSAYFETSMKDAALPGGAEGITKFKGTLISMTPPVRPKELELGIENASVPDVTLKLDSALSGKMEPGAQIEFAGVAKSYTKEPFMVTFSSRNRRSSAGPARTKCEAAPRSSRDEFSNGAEACVTFSKMKFVALALVAFLSYAVAQDAPPAKKPPSQAEYDLIQKVSKEPDANARLTLLDQWAKDFPNSDYADVRRNAYLITYLQLKRHKEAFNMAAEMIKTDPNNVLALGAIVSEVYSLQPPAAADLDTAEKAANYILANLDTIYAPDKKPANQTAAQWEQTKAAMKPYAQRTIGWIYLTRKDYPRAEKELETALQLDPTQALASEWLAQAVLAQNKTNPEQSRLRCLSTPARLRMTGPGAWTRGPATSSRPS